MRRNEKPNKQDLVDGKKEKFFNSEILTLMKYSKEGKTRKLIENEIKT